MPSVLKVNEIQSDTSLPLVFNVGNAERGRIDTSGNMGIGQPNPSNPLHIYAASAPQIRIQDANGSFYIGRDSSSNALLNMNQAYAMIFQTSGTERARFNSTGAFVFAGGTTTADGIGITFPATQSASTNANTLDDYEEGTFTPTVSGSTVAGTGTYNTQVGTYTKIGRLVTVTVTVGWTAHTGTGNLRVSDLPFTSANITNAYSTFVVDYVNLTVPASSLAFGEMGPNITYANLFSTPTGTGSSAGLAMDTAATLYFSLTYQAS